MLVLVFVFFLKLRAFSVGPNQLPPKGQHSSLQLYLHRPQCLQCPQFATGSCRTRMLGSLEYIFHVQIQLQACSVLQKFYQRWRLTTASNKYECMDLKNNELITEISNICVKTYDFINVFVLDQSEDKN